MVNELKQDLEKASERIADQQNRISEQQKQISKQDEQISKQDEKIAEQRKKIAEQQRQVQNLERELADSRKNSTNSSKPPSSDGLAGPQRERGRKPGTKCKRRAGGQPGHAGHNRQPVEAAKVSETIEVLPKQCLGCGQEFPSDITSANAIGEPYRHQVVDLPPIEPGSRNTNATNWPVRGAAKPHARQCLRRRRIKPVRGLRHWWLT